MPSGADEVLAAFAERAASIAVRHQDSREVRAGLLAAVIALDLTTDQRDVVPVLALLYRATEMIGDDPALAFLTVTELCGGRTRPLREFLARSPADKTIQAMGYDEGDDGHGFRFRRTW
ncbi:hypothetical protein [Kribbella flavida]|uniref:hypothetical protein n=1 Tax=Kribbella flavida TaxID=182640 RepID=UPI00019BDE2C|nr:hypothetical protein [Kribbella flavida]